MKRRIPKEILAIIQRYRDTCSYEITEITPDVAREEVEASGELEKLTPPQRKRLAEKAAIYGRSMAANNWVRNGDTIVYDIDGKLVDGLARLVACYDSDVPFECIVFRGIPREAALTLGSHLRRTAADILDINGEACPNAIAHAWPVIIAYLNAADRRKYSKAKFLPATPSEMIALTDRYPAIRRSAKLVAESGVVGVLGAGTAVALHFITALADEAMADRFMNTVGDPTLDPESAAAALGVRARALKRSPQAYRLAIAIKAWNRFVAGKPIKPESLDYTGKVGIAGGTLEAFPVVARLSADARIDVTGIHGETGALVRSYEADGPIEEGAEPTLDIEYIDWEQAGEILERNGPVGTERNRKIRKAHVERLGRDMVNDRWTFNAQPLKFGRSGRLLDGQHRCTASHERRKGFITFTVRGLDDGVFSTFDGGESKSFGKHMKHEGVVNSTVLAASIAFLHKVLTNSGELITIPEGVALRAAHPDLADHARLATRKGVKAFLQPSVATVLSYLFSQKDPIASERFFNDLVQGANLDDNDPMLRLRNALMRGLIKSSYPLPEQKAKIAIQTWNARRKGVRLRGFTTTVGYPEIL